MQKIALIDLSRFDEDEQDFIDELVERIEKEFPKRPILVCHGADLQTIKASNGGCLSLYDSFGPSIDWREICFARFVEPPQEWFE